MRRRRRAAPGLAGRSRGQTAPMSEGWDESDFPIDGPAPDDLPVRDVADEELHPTQGLDTGFAQTFVRNPAGAAFDRVEDGAEPESAPSPCSSAALHPEAAENDAPELLAPPERAEPPAQPFFPAFEPDDAAAERARQMTRPRRLRDSTRKKALKAAQIELWPDDTFSGPIG